MTGAEVSAPDARDAADEAARRRYWLRTGLLTSSLLATWFCITFFSAYFADELNRVDFLGFPLGFYLCAQGNLWAFLLIVWLYARIMNRMDAELEAGHAPPTEEAD
ncbi:MAG: DUF4212 domain-containing protein [Rhodocyclaceae bacterium]|nr:DUF4212 domain-containing protein [Rhodocyclaceae bacterium]